MDAEATTSASTATAPRRRGPGRPFKPGQTGNPGGLPRDTRGLIERARRLALRFAPKAIKALGELLDHEDARVRVAAAEGLLDRAGLRPFALEPERVQVEHTIDAGTLRATLLARLARLDAPREGDAKALSEANSGACDTAEGVVDAQARVLNDPSVGQPPSTPGSTP